MRLANALWALLALLTRPFRDRFSHRWPRVKPARAGVDRGFAPLTLAAADRKYAVGTRPGER